MDNVTHFPTLETDRFILRQFSDDDLENVFLGLSNPHVIKYYGISFNSMEATKEQISWFRNLEEEGKGVWWAICSKDLKLFYGAGGLNDVDKQNHKAEIGLWLMPQFWGKGIMTEVMPHICKYGFNHLALHRIEGSVDSENKSCKKGLAKLNFNFEGTMVDCEFKDGRYISIDVYATLDNK